MTIGPSITKNSQSRTTLIWEGRVSFLREAYKLMVLIQMRNLKHKRNSKMSFSKCSAIIDVEITVIVLYFLQPT